MASNLLIEKRFRNRQVTGFHRLVSPYWLDCYPFIIIKKDLKKMSINPLVVFTSIRAIIYQLCGYFDCKGQGYVLVSDTRVMLFFISTHLSFIFRALKIRLSNFYRIMQIRELTIPPSSKRVTYQISEDGKLAMVKNQPQKRENILSNFIGKWQGCKIELGQLNSIQLTKNSRFQDILKDNPFVSIQTPQPRPQENKRKLKCNCKKSKCLKLYCECFSNQLYCNKECQCINCANLQMNSKRLYALREEVNSKRAAQGKGCRCTKSNCQKKYCDCYNRGVKCGQFCYCQNCTNCFINEKVPDQI